jgi:hypothetical protein
MDARLALLADRRWPMAPTISDPPSAISGRLRKRHLTHQQRLLNLKRASLVPCLGSSLISSAAPSRALPPWPEMATGEGPLLVTDGVSNRRHGPDVRGDGPAVAVWRVLVAGTAAVAVDDLRHQALHVVEVG